MDNKILLQILLRDVADLEELVKVMRKTASFRPLEFELLQTKISGVKHMLEVIVEDVPDKKQAVVEKPHKQVVEKEVAAADSVAEEKQIKVEPIVKEPPKQMKADLPEPVVNVEAEPVEEEKVEIRAQVEEEKPVVEKERVLATENEEEVALEEEPVAPVHQTFGEKFTHSRSVNDLLLEQGKPDSKFAHMPVTSLQSAIGINDRFLFVRELFNGSNDIYNEAVSKLDAMTGIQDAAAYLRENFKWKKNETSLKFIDLVKRRFIGS